MTAIALHMSVIRPLFHVVENHVNSSQSKNKAIGPFLDWLWGIFHGDEHDSEKPQKGTFWAIREMLHSIEEDFDASHFDDSTNSSSNFRRHRVLVVRGENMMKALESIELDIIVMIPSFQRNQDNAGSSHFESFSLVSYVTLRASLDKLQKSMHGGSYIVWVLNLHVFYE